VIGLEYASMGAALGIQVTVIEARDELLGFVDREIVEHLMTHLTEHGVTFLLGEEVDGIHPQNERSVRVHLKSGGEVVADGVLYAVGRQPNTDTLNLESISLPVDARGRLKVNEEFQTEISHIYAAGDVIGFPALASTSAEQGRVAASHMFGLTYRHSPELLPYGIYTIPEISTVGKTEHELRKAGRAYAVGRAWFRELAKAQIIGDRTGLLKLVFDPKSLAVLGVHVTGDGASELVHIGLAVMMANGTIEDLRDMVFNYPTLAEAYKVAALNGLNALASSQS
jgi:NAD(P) transhydrogenase